MEPVRYTRQGGGCARTYTAGTYGPGPASTLPTLGEVLPSGAPTDPTQNEPGVVRDVTIVRTRLAGSAGRLIDVYA